MKISGASPTLVPADTPEQPEEPTPVIKFGFITDVHYADKATSINRYYRDGCLKMEEAVDQFDAAGVDFVIQLGDLVDQSSRTKAQALADLSTVMGSYTPQAPKYHAFGNHCLEKLSKAEFFASTGMASGYYSFDVGSTRFIVLDPCYRSNSDTDHYDSGNYTYTKAYVPPGQMSWLSTRLTEWPGKAVVFCHYRLIGSTHVLTNASAVRSTMAAAGNVIAVFSGHAHTNDLDLSAGTTHYEMMAATEWAFPSNAFAVVTIGEGYLNVQGFKSQLSRP